MHSVTLVTARSMYGYRRSEQVFAKVQLYDPRDVKRASELLQVLQGLCPLGKGHRRRKQGERAEGRTEKREGE